MNLRECLLHSCFCANKSYYSQPICNQNLSHSYKDDYLKDCDLNTKTDEERAFSKEEIQRIKQNAKRTPKEPCALMTLLASETGMRAGELSALLKSDVSDGFIHVHRQLLRNNRDGHVASLTVPFRYAGLIFFFEYSKKVSFDFSTNSFVK